MKNPRGLSYLVEDLSRDVRLRIKEMQHITGVLDSVLGCLLWGGETVVAGSMEILEAAGVVL